MPSPCGSRYHGVDIELGEQMGPDLPHQFSFTDVNPQSMREEEKTRKHHGDGSSCDRVHQ